MKSFVLCEEIAQVWNKWTKKGTKLRDSCLRNGHCFVLLFCVDELLYTGT